jgi:hypothetical protein
LDGIVCGNVVAINKAAEDICKISPTNIQRFVQSIGSWNMRERFQPQIFEKLFNTFRSYRRHVMKSKLLLVKSKIGEAAQSRGQDDALSEYLFKAVRTYLERIDGSGNIAQPTDISSCIQSLGVGKIGHPASW